VLDYLLTFPSTLDTESDAGILQRVLTVFRLDKSTLQLSTMEDLGNGHGSIKDGRDQLNIDLPE